MFESIIFYISALVLCISYPLTFHGSFSIGMLICFLLISFIFFYFLSSYIFKNLYIKRSLYEILSFKSRLISFIAILFLGIDLYLLHIPDIFLRSIRLKSIPTLVLFLMLLIFSVYMFIVWFLEWKYCSDTDIINIEFNEHLLLRAGFVISFILPWLVTSLVFDLIHFLPYKNFIKLIDSDAGQIVYLIFFLLIFALMIPFAFKKIWRCEELEDLETIYVLKELSMETGIKYHKAFLWPFPGGNIITAGVVGIFRKFRYILVTRGFVNLLEKDEKKAVLAHEFGHIRHHHMFWYIFIFAGFVALSYFFIDQLLVYFISMIPVSTEILMGKNDLLELITALVNLVSFVLYFRYIFSFFMRNFEREADIFSFISTGTQPYLISTFKKIDLMSVDPPDKPDWHHFSILERIRFLISCYIYPQNIRKHSRKLKSNIAIYFIVVGTLVIFGLFIGSRINGDILVNHIFFPLN